MKKVSFKVMDRIILGFCLGMVFISMIGVMTTNDVTGYKVCLLSASMWGGMFLLFHWLFKERGA